MRLAFETHPSLSRRLARVIWPVSLLTALLLSTATPVTRFVLSYGDLSASGNSVAARVSAELSRFVGTSSQLWMYNSAKVASHFGAHISGDNRLYLEIQDGDGRVAYRRDPGEAPYVWTSRTVAVSGADSATVLIGVSARGLLATGLALLLSFTLLGLLFAVTLYRVPLRFLRRAEEDLLAAFSDLSQARGELELSNEELERRVEQKTDKLRVASDLVREQHQRLQALASHVFAAQEEERLRIAKDLHDPSGQMLTAVRIALESAVRLHRQDGDAPEGALGQILDRTVELVNETTEGIRRSIHVLGTPLLDQGGLKAALATLVSCFQQANCQISCDLDGVPRSLRPAVESCAFRVCQEALTNALKHGKPGKVEICGSVAHDHLRISISDDGTWKADGEEGFGLSTMRDRVALLGGKLEVQALPGQGTNVSAVIPLAPVVIED